MKTPDIAVYVSDASPESLRFVARGLAIHAKVMAGDFRQIEPAEDEIQAKMDQAKSLVLQQGPAQA